MLKKIFRKVRDRVKKGITDIGSFAGDNPLITAGAAAFGLPALFGAVGGTGGSSILDLIRRGVGGFDKIQNKRGYGNVIEGSGLLGAGQDIWQGISGKDKMSGIASIINSFLAKKAFDDEKANELRKEKEMKDRYDLISNRWGSQTGGTPFVEEMIKGTVYDPETDKMYDYYDRETDTYGYFEADESGRIKNRNQGGIAQLNIGGQPGNSMSFKLPARRATGGIMDEMVSEEIFDPRMSGNQMMNEIKKNPGITEFFPPKFGEIRGPGGPKDDKIPAMLSDGEFVMTAKAVDNAGGPEAMYGIMNALDPESSKGKGII
tara:strand:- start:321 stop:1274 length:954 start_codon:yes stop_codon:yes gene_type:complete